MKSVDFRIIANQSDITDKIRDRLLSLTLNDVAGIENDTLEITLDNRDQQIALPTTGAELDIYIGYANQLVFKGTYTVDEISEPLEIDTLTISAQAAKMKSSFKAPRDHSYDEINLGQLVEQLGERHHYEVQVAPSLATIPLKHLDQRAESDSNLLARLAKENDAICKVAANQLLFMPKQQGKTVTGQDLPTIEITDPQHSTGTITIQDRAEYQTVIAYWFDENAQEKQIERAGAGDPEYVIQKTHTDQSAAQRAATAKLHALQRGKAQLSITRPLNPLIVAEGFLHISQHKVSANGRWLVESVSHTITNALATTKIKAAVA